MFKLYIRSFYIAPCIQSADLADLLLSVSATPTDRNLPIRARYLTSHSVLASVALTDLSFSVLAAPADTACGRYSEIQPIRSRI